MIGAALLMVLVGAVYKHPIPGFIFTAIVCGTMIVIAGWVWVQNYGWHLHWREARDQTPRQLGQIHEQ